MQKDAFFQKLEKHVVGVFDVVRLKAEAAGEKFARTPYTDELFSIHHEYMFPYLERTVCRALIHRQSFRETAPHWAPPELPLSPAEWEKMISGKSNRIALVGFYGRSLACAEWSNIHLSFYHYCSGLMACEYTPPCIRADLALLKEFPPHPFQGFDKSLCWGAHARIIEFTQLLMRNEEIWYGCGMADEAGRMRDAIELLMELSR